MAIGLHNSVQQLWFLLQSRFR